jgi:hypothetical protein
MQVAVIGTLSAAARRSLDEAGVGVAKRAATTLVVGKRSIPRSRPRR